MKKNILKISLAVLGIGLLGACSNSDLDDLEKRVDVIESKSIATVNEQITSINASINELKNADKSVLAQIEQLQQVAGGHQLLIDELKEADKNLAQKDKDLEARIAALESQQKTINGQISDLVKADEAINKRIDELKSYVENELKKYATTDWANATFATLEQYQKTADDLAVLSVTVKGISTSMTQMQSDISSLNAKIDVIDPVAFQQKIDDLATSIASLKSEFEGKISDAVSQSEANLKAWIATQLEGYYTAAQADAKLAAMKSDLEASIAAGDSKNADAIAEAKADIAKLEADLNQAKKDLTDEYQKAISDAINGNGGYINDKIKQEFDNANSRIDILTAQVSDLETKVDALTGRVEKLEKMIQSVTIVPAYDDGSVEVIDDSLELNCIVKPAEALTDLDESNFTIYANYAKKTRTSGAYTEIAVSKYEVMDGAQGAIRVKAKVSDYLPSDDTKTLTVALYVKNGISNFTTEFVNVGAVITSFPWFGVAPGKWVIFAPGNMYWDGSGFKFETNQWDFASDWNPNHVSHFYWSKTASVAYAESYSDASASADDVFFTNATETTAKSDFTVNGQTGVWRTLSKEEWKYLFGTSMTRNGKYKAGVQIDGKRGLVIAPDNFTGTISRSYTVADWAAAEAEGLVFLPCAGFRHGSSVDGGSDGNYWSSSLDVSATSYAYGMSLYMSSVGSRSCSDGSSVRLVRSAK